MTDERIIDKFLNRKCKIGNIDIKCIDILFFVCVSVLAVLVRAKLYPLSSADYTGFLEPWMAEIRKYGAFRSLKYEISNYSSSYMYLMGLVSGANNILYALKNVSLVFEFSAAVAAMFIVYCLTNSSTKAILGYSLLILCPTVLIDGSWWCQCDIIYTSFILWSLYFFFKNKGEACWIFIGLAFSFKLQTLFIIPFFIIMWLKNKNMKLYYVLIVPIVYIIMQVPATIAGRPLKDLLLIYFDQAGYYPWGTLEYPNAYVFVDELMPNARYADWICPAGTILTIALLGILAYVLYSVKFEVTGERAILIAMFTVMLCVYFLPHMHERYGFLVDLLGIIYVIIKPKRFWVLIGLVMVSVVSYMPYLIGARIFEMKTVATVLLGLIAFIGYDLFSSIRQDTNPSSIEA